MSTRPGGDPFRSGRNGDPDGSHTGEHALRILLRPVDESGSGTRNVRRRAGPRAQTEPSMSMSKETPAPRSEQKPSVGTAPFPNSLPCNSGDSRRRLSSGLPRSHHGCAEGHAPGVTRGTDHAPPSSYGGTHGSQERKPPSKGGAMSAKIESLPLHRGISLKVRAIALAVLVALVA